MTAADAHPFLLSLTVAGDPGPWSALGFHVEDGRRCRVGTTRVDLTAPTGEPGLVAWTLAGCGAGDLDGLPTRWDGDVAAVTPAPAVHLNGALRLDHVVVFTPQLERTTTALAAAGMDLRRTREAGTPEHPLRQAFYRLGEVILEVVGDVVDRGADAPARFWGLVAVVPDVDALAQQLGAGLVGTPKDAVQPGRRILTVRREAGLGVPLAFLTPDPRRG